MSRPPGLFVSSTCFDLRQIRADIIDFATSLGLEPVLSEYNSFPIDPDLSAVENCIRAVEERADILLLIVGRRYGSIVSGNKSVTNLEYTRARAKGIPIYVFVQRSIVEMLELWRGNPTMDFSAVVESPLVFGFVDQLRHSEGVWAFTFDLAQDIIVAMRRQLAFLFMDALTARARLRGAAIPDQLKRLSARALRLLVDRPEMWEYRLFACHLTDEIARAKRERLDLNYGVALGRRTRYDSAALTKWSVEKMEDLAQLIQATHKIVEVIFPDAIGPPGTPADTEKVVYCAERLSEVHLELIRWSNDFGKVAPEPEQATLVRLLAEFTSRMIEEIELFARGLLPAIEKAMKDKVPFRAALVLTAPDVGQLNRTSF